MDISLKLNKDFERALQGLIQEFGEEFEYINGIHPSQLDYSEFLDKFIDRKTLADSTIDPNANANHKDIRSYITEKGKPSDKLFGLSKIFYEIKKRWGLKTAKDWLRQEFSKGFYLNDSSSASLFPYCYNKSEMITAKYNGKVYIISFEQLYDLIEEPEILLNLEDAAYAKRPVNLFVLDIVDGQQVFTQVTQVVKHKRTNNFHYIKLSNGLDQIVTEDHTLITARGEIAACNAEAFDDTLNTINVNYTDCITEIIDTLPNGINLTKELGYISGLLITDGTYNNGSVRFCQNDGPVVDKFIDCCNKCNISISDKTPNTISRRVGDDDFKNLLFSYILKKATNSNKEFLPQIFNYNRDFLVGLLSGVIDGDGAVPKHWNNMCSFLSSSRTLRNQIAQICMILGFKPRCQLRIYNKGFDKVYSNDHFMYGVDFRIYENSTPLFSAKIATTCSNFLSEKRSDAAIRYPYTTGFGQKEIIENYVIDSEDDTVYDITTETHHFICNNILSHNCWANDLTRLATEGLFFLGKYNNEAPKHLLTYFDDVIEFVSFLSNRQSGAVGLPNVLIWAYYFWKHDVNQGYFIKDPEYYLRQSFQKFIYRLNQPFLRIDQSAFTNVSIFDRPYLESLFGGVIFPDGSLAIDGIEEIIHCQEIFMEVVSEIRKVNMFTYPVLTYSLLKRPDLTQEELDEMIRTKNWDIFVDKKFAQWASKHNMEWYDSNFFISDNVGVLSNCCRLLSDTRKLDAFINSIGGTSLSVGSCRVSTINLARIAYEALGFDKSTSPALDEINKTKAKQKYIKILEERTLLDCKALTSMRHIIERNIEKGLLPNYCDGALELDKQFCTIGGVALYEVMDLFGLIDTDEFGNKYYSEEGIDFATKILDTMNEVKNNFECDFSINIEFVPGENLCGTLCTADNLIFGQDKYFIYSNQWIPLFEKCTLQEKCKLGKLFDEKCGGGCIAHINVENRFPNEKAAWDMLNYVAASGVIYSAFTTKINVCQHKHASIGTTICPECGEPIVDQFARVVGFYTPVSSYQKIRKREFDLRKWYNVLESDKLM